jgi:chromatin remodeling complex protein RSC6
MSVEVSVAPQKRRIRPKPTRSEMKEQTDVLLEKLAAPIGGGGTPPSFKAVLSGLRKAMATLIRAYPENGKLRRSKRTAAGASSGGEPGKTAVSGFKKLMQISEPLAKFLHWTVGEPHSRIDVMKGVCKYIKDNKLQSTADKRLIIPNSELASILMKDNKPENYINLTYLNLQSFYSHHLSALPATAPAAEV